MATLRKNVVTHLYVVHCMVNGRRHNEFVEAESDDTAKLKAKANLDREYGGIGDYKLVDLERINPDED